MSQEPDLLIQIHGELKSLTEKIESAFPKDEYNNVDYIGHRLFHKQQNDSAKQYSSTKSALIKGVIIWATIGLVTIIANTIGEVYITPLLLAIKAAH